MASLYPYSIGDMRCAVPQALVWVKSPSSLVTQKRLYAKAHGIPENRVWSERDKYLPIKED